MTEVWQNFHFLRPLWLVGLILLPLIWWLLAPGTKRSSDWSKSIAPQLLKHLTPTSQQQSSPLGRRLVLPALVLTLLALAGPSWQQKPSPVVQVKDDMVVILDLSLSMLATDLAPNRLTRAKQKLQDFLALRTEGTTALIVFSGDSHVVTPLTDDTQTIVANLPALEPLMMPVIGSRPDLAIEQALSLLDQAQLSRGRILLITDGVESKQAERIGKTLKRRAIDLNILAVGTAAGGPINMPERGYLKDDGAVVIPKTDIDSLKDIAAQNDGVAVAMTLDDDDLNRLKLGSSAFAKELEKQNDSSLDPRFDRWEDAGIWLCLALVPLVLLSYRQGALLLLLLVLWQPEESWAFEWSELWQTRDQQAQTLLENKDYAAAAEKFDSPEHKAFASYQAENYAAAASTFSALDTARTHYNQGNALAQQLQFQEAIDAYNKALEIDPNYEDALTNKDLIEEFLTQQQAQQEQQPSSSGENGEPSQEQASEDQDGQNQQQSEQQSDQQSEQGNQEDGQQGQEQPNQQGSESEQNSSEQSQGEQNQNAQQETEQSASKEGQQDGQENTPSQPNTISDAEQAAADEALEKQAQTMIEEMDHLSDEERQSFEQWMRRVPDDPGGLLRRKFEQQSRERNRIQREEGEPLW